MYSEYYSAIATICTVMQFADHYMPAMFIGLLRCQFCAVGHYNSWASLVEREIITCNRQDD